MSATHRVNTQLGGNRLGSGSKMDVSLHNYNRSTHDLSRAWRSSMTVGTLIPFMKEPDLNGDTWEIDLNAIVRTIPTRGPIYGSFKMQMDIFECPIRLYNGLLHNNMVKLGLQMEKVKLPKMTLKTKVKHPGVNCSIPEQISPSSLLHYLGISGIGGVKFARREDVNIERKVQCVPVLAYYDIVKNYYCNKQEDKGAYITPKFVLVQSKATELTNFEGRFEFYQQTQNYGQTQKIQYLRGTFHTNWPTFEQIDLYFTSVQSTNEMKLRLVGENPNDTSQSIQQDIAITTLYNVISTDGSVLRLRDEILPQAFAGYNVKIAAVIYTPTTSSVAEDINIKKFPLENIDEARIKILRETGLNEELQLEDLPEPYIKITDVDELGFSLSQYPLNGICLKTYQADLMNNWLNTEWIDGENGIRNLTAIDVSSGLLYIDSLILQKKTYNLLTRIATGGGTYEDWQEVVFTANVNRRAETPVYKGGASAEIVFSEVVSNTATEDQPLGTLAGKGDIANTKGGKIVIHCDEPSYIIGIVSITPRVDYSQGNDWDMMELDNMDDLHKPEYDGIGFEDLLQERGAYWGTYYDVATEKWVKMAMGKVPAWINYQTALNKTHGDFADEEKAMYMTLNRRYEKPTYENNDVEPLNGSMGIQDLTTYVDPRKYNYAFAYNELDAMNFWVQIGVKAIARRVMSAKMIPQA